MDKRHTRSQKGKGKMPAKEKEKKMFPLPPPTRQRTGVVIREQSATIPSTIAAPPSESQPPPQPLSREGTPSEQMFETLSIEEKVRCRSLLGRDFSETRTLGNASIGMLGVRDEVIGLLRNISFLKFVRPSYPGYKNLTCEFLSSLVVQKKLGGDLGYYGMTFKMLGKKMTMTKSQMDECFGFSSMGLSSFANSTMDIQEFWGEIGSTPKFRAAHTPAKSLNTLTLFVLHKAIVNSIFAKKEGNDKISQKDLLFLHCAVKNQPIQASYFFIDHLLHLQHTKTGAIVVGSFISQIAYFLSFDLTKPQAYLLSHGLSVDLGLMDLDYFVQKVKIVTKQEDGTYLYLGGVTDEEREARLREREEKAREDREARQKEREEKAREEGSRAGSMEEGVGIPHGQPIDIPHIEIRDMR